jgi:hypothetical protein
MGQVIQKGVVNETIDLTNLIRGTYLLTLADETATVTKVLVKQ